MIIGAASVCELTTGGTLAVGCGLWAVGCGLWAVGCGGIAVPNKVGAARPLGISRSTDKYVTANKLAGECAPVSHLHKQIPALS